MALTESKIRTMLPEPNRDYYIKDGEICKGLTVRVLQTGNKTFYMNYAHPETGKNVRWKLGKFPALTLKAARIKVKEARTLLAHAKDPKTAEKQTKRQASSLGTVEDLCNAYYQKLKANKKSSLPEIKRAVFKDILDKDNLDFCIADMKACEVEPDDISMIIHNTIERGAPVQANRVRAYLHSMFQNGLKYDHQPKNAKSGIKFQLKFNPVTLIEKDKSVENVIDRVLTWQEIHDLVNSDLLSDIHKLQLKLILALGGRRPSEVIKIQMSEIDYNEQHWILPVDRSLKNGLPLLVPLTPLAIDLIDQAYSLVNKEGIFLFPSRGNPKAKKPLGRNTLSIAVKKYWEKQGVEQFTPRDLRTTFKTLGGSLGLSKEIRDRVQHHSLTKDVSGKHYDFYDYMREKREALEIWCEKLSEVF